MLIFSKNPGLNRIFEEIRKCSPSRRPTRAHGAAWARGESGNPPEKVSFENISREGSLSARVYEMTLGVETEFNQYGFKATDFHS